MKKIKIAIKNNSACLLSPIDLVAGTKGLECQFFYDSTWESYKEITIKLRVGSDIYGPYLVENASFTIPASILEEPGDILQIALTANTTSQTIPTSWCHIGKIRHGASDEVTSILPDEDDDIHIIYDGGVVE